jgi:hypothetical protein
MTTTRLFESSMALPSTFPKAYARDGVIQGSVLMLIKIGVMGMEKSGLINSNGNTVPWSKSSSSA